VANYARNPSPTGCSTAKAARARGVESNAFNATEENLSQEGFSQVLNKQEAAGIGHLMIEKHEK
jgi:hypothetical protein